MAALLNSRIKLPYRYGISKFTYTPWAQKHAVKEASCFFCSQTCSNKQLLTHLESNDRCNKSYLALTGASSTVAAVMIVLNCMFCDDADERFDSHLMRNPVCLEAYEAKFNVDGRRLVINYL